MCKHSNVLDAVRGLAILLVVSQHWLAFPAGWIGVDLFFLLSGFLIGGILIDNRHSNRYFATFYIRRGWRIVPLYLILLAIGGLGSSACTFHWQYLTFSQNFLWATSGANDCGSMLVTWSLAVEEQFYCLLPLLVRCVPPRVLPALCLTLAGLALPCRLMLMSDIGSVAGCVLLPARMDTLFAGVFIACLMRRPRLHDTIRRYRRWLWTTACIAGSGFLMIGTKGGFAWNNPMMEAFGFSMIAVMFASALIGVIASGWEPSARFPLCALGVGAYSIYLFHYPLAAAIDALITAGPVGNIVACCLTQTVASTLAWRLIERPVIQWSRRRWCYDRSTPSRLKTPALQGQVA